MATPPQRYQVDDREDGHSRQGPRRVRELSGALATRSSARRVPGVPGSLLGNAVRRLEDPALLTGRARYVDNLPIEGALHLAFVRSPVAHARVTGIDVAEAE